ARRHALSRAAYFARWPEAVQRERSAPALEDPQVSDRAPSTEFQALGALSDPPQLEFPRSAPARSSRESAGAWTSAPGSGSIAAATSCAPWISRTRAKSPPGLSTSL